VTVELQGQLLAWERELDSQEHILMAREDGLAASECALGRARMECDGECGCPTGLPGYGVRFYSWLPAFPRLRLGFGGAHVLYFLAGDRLRMTGGEVGCGTRTWPLLLRQEGSTGGAGGASRVRGWD
jgi:hypothetical protein